MADKELTRASLGAAALSGLGMAFSTGPIVLATFSLFMLPMAKEFGWGRGAISFGLVVSSGCAALADPFVGRLVDRWGVRRVVIPGIALFGLANAGLAFVGGSLGLLYLVFAFVGMTSVSCAAVPFSKVITAWFSSRRGLALGLSLGLGAGLGAALSSQLARALIAEFGWRDARIALAGLILLLPLPLMLAFLREPGPARGGGIAPRPTPAGLSGREARRQPTFWLMFGMILVGTTALAGAVVHMVALLTDRGLSAAAATSVYSLYAVANVAGRIVAGWLQDRFQTPRVGLPVYGVALLGLALLAYGSGVPAFALGSVLMGLGFGAEIALGSYWVSRYWGVRCYGEIYGVIYAAASAGAAAGPFVMGWAFDLTGSYRWALLGFQAAMAACLLGVMAMGRYAYAAGPGGQALVASPAPAPP